MNEVEETITLSIKVRVEQQVTVPVVANYDLETIKNNEADKAHERYINNPNLLSFEELEYKDIIDVEVKD
ncbi:hypothetical protein M3559_03465 [Staphylococcus equorum]|uniref:hypothetical protein n=1 Tax=Staphylococcus equorum TaxID=246432 RepID=UPI00203D75ED|nr:hypothetical protein [Staphylococcus equorum]MCM3071710.1 hypothetical protein [Staphylococcus equorum]